MYNKFQQVYDYHCRVFRNIRLVDGGTPPKQYGQMLSYKKGKGRKHGK